MLNTAIDSKRQTIDMLHPMYDIKVSALASVGYGKSAHRYVSKLRIVNCLVTCSGSCLADTNTAKLVRW